MWIVDVFDPDKRTLIMIPRDILSVRYSILSGSCIYFFGYSLTKLWHLKRMYRINIMTGSVAEIPLSPIFECEDGIDNINVVDGAWNFISQQLFITLLVRIGKKTHRHLITLDLATRTWKSLKFSAECSIDGILDVKHRFDPHSNSIILFIHHIKSYRTLVYRLLIR